MTRCYVLYYSGCLVLTQRYAGAAFAFGNWLSLSRTTIGDADQEVGQPKDPTMNMFSDGHNMQRLKWVMPDRLTWFWRGRIGVNFSSKVGYYINKDFVAPFSNAAQHPLPILSDGIHVDIGFVDLGVLAETLIAHNHHFEQQQQIDKEEGVGATQEEGAHAFIVSRV